MEVGVPAGDAFFDVSRVVRHWIDADVLEHDHRSAALDNAEEDVVRFGSLKGDLEPETVAIKRQRGGDILDDEERRNAGDLWFGHVSFHPPFSTRSPRPATGSSRAGQPPGESRSPTAPRRAGRPRGCQGSALPCAWTRQGGQAAATCRGRKQP